jgi:hypothetical protein
LQSPAGWKTARLTHSPTKQSLRGYTSGLVAGFSTVSATPLYRRATARRTPQ